MRTLEKISEIFRKARNKISSKGGGWCNLKMLNRTTPPFLIPHFEGHRKSKQMVGLKYLYDNSIQNGVKD